MAERVNFVVLGVVPSKSNSYKVGRGHFYRDDSVATYEDDFASQTGQVKKFTFSKKDNLMVVYEFYVKNMGQDSDNIEKTVNDCLQKNDIIPNDKKIIFHQTTKISDRNNPRIKISISKMEKNNG